MADRFDFDLGDWFSGKAEQVHRYLHRYFYGGEADPFTGRWFEKFAGLGHPDRFGPSDLVAVESLSVNVKSESAAKLLLTDADHFNSHLEQIPDGFDLWELPRSVVESGSAADELHAALKRLDDVAGVKATKLIAAKRPRVIPILDSKVEELLKPPEGRFWVTMHDELANAARRQIIAAVTASAPAGVSLLRRIDVALWMHATHPL